MHTRIPASLAALLLATVPALAQDAFVDRVSTLQLSEELDSRGQLGGITVDRLGFLYVANFRDKVWRISPEGEVAVLADSFYGASGNAVDSRGDLLQANFFANAIDRVSRTGGVTRIVSSGLQGPVGIAVGTDDTLYVCNCSGNYLSKISPSGEVEKLAESELFACPNGITLGPDDHLYVTNFNHRDVLRVSMDGKVERFVTVPGGAGNAHITFSKGFFYVTKIVANQLVRISATGEVFPMAGTGSPGFDDGPAPEATFASPNGIAASPTGDRLYVNTLDGERTVPKPSKIVIRAVELMTLTKALDAALASGGLDELGSTFARYSEDAVRGRENTVGEMIAYGYRFLSGGQFTEALTVFTLNAEGNPTSAPAQFHLGEAHRYLGNAEAAVEQFRRTLQLDPEHPQAASRLQQLGASREGDQEP